MKNRTKSFTLSIAFVILLFGLTISTTQVSVGTSPMIEIPGSFVYTVDSNHFDIGMLIGNSMCLEFTKLNPTELPYNVEDRMNYTLIDVQPDQYIFDEIIYSPNGTIHMEGNYSVSRLEIRIPLFVTTNNQTLIQEAFSTTPDWNISYFEYFLYMKQTAYDYPELGDTMYSEYVYDSRSGWLMSLYQKRTAADQTITMEMELIAITATLPPITTIPPTSTEIPTTMEETSESTTEPTLENTTTSELTTDDSNTSTNTTTIPDISSFVGFAEILGVIAFVIVIYRRKR